MGLVRRDWLPLTCPKCSGNLRMMHRMCDLGIGSMHSDEGSRRKPKYIGKIMNKINDLEFRMCKMSTSDNQSHETPYKSQVAPPSH